MGYGRGASRPAGAGSARTDEGRYLVSMTIERRTIRTRPNAGFALVLAVAALLWGGAWAQSAAVVDPASSLHRAQPGETVEGIVRLTNPGDDPLPLRVYLSDWSFDAVGNFTFAEAGSTARSASSWLSFAPTAVEVAPSGSGIVRYTVSVPPDAEPGTHWAVIFAESEPSAPEPGQPAAAISVRVGHIVYVNVPPLASEGTIRGIFGESPTEGFPAYRLLVQYANMGNAAQGVEGTLSVRDGRGETAIEAAVDRQVVLPGSERVLQFNLVGPLAAGNYTALVVLDYGAEDVEVAGTHDFTLVDDLVAPEGD